MVGTLWLKLNVLDDNYWHEITQKLSDSVNIEKVYAQFCLTYKILNVWMRRTIKCSHHLVNENWMKIEWKLWKSLWEEEKWKIFLNAMHFLQQSKKSWKCIQSFNCVLLFYFLQMWKIFERLWFRRLDRENFHQTKIPPKCKSFS